MDGRVSEEGSEMKRERGMKRESENENEIS